MRWLSIWVLSLEWLGRKRKCAAFVRPLGEGSTPKWRCGGRSKSLHYLIPWHLPYNPGKITENPQSGHQKSARLISADNDSISRLGHHQAMASTVMLAAVTLGFHFR
jgi:hypothetical protein